MHKWMGLRAATSIARLWRDQANTSTIALSVSASTAHFRPLSEDSGKRMLTLRLTYFDPEPAFRNAVVLVAWEHKSIEIIAHRSSPHTAAIRPSCRSGPKRLRGK